MYKCPHGEKQTDKENVDEYIGRWLWHMNNCTCPVMEAYDYFMLDQSNHCKDYWENTGKIKVRWHKKVGLTFEYPVTLMDIIDVRYPYHD